jgi:hypothetical protein
MCLYEHLKSLALEWAGLNSIAMPGDIVIGNRGNWKKSKPVLINSCGCELVGEFCGQYSRETGRFEGIGFITEFAMYYNAKRLNKDGSIFKNDRGASAICLGSLTAKDGRTWCRSPHGFNHASLSWELARMAEAEMEVGA